ncbi:Xaa-Pro peptidase family protein [Pelovirga terrestris]|uniref:M24 family metallopeptidase n=1 Tax=Pelovirga terrestris TaxID=2771352 RepID=UPI0030806A97
MSDSHAFVQQLLVTEQLDAVLVVSRCDLRYLCGFSGSDGVLLCLADSSVFLTDSRYQEQARQQVVADEIRCYKSKFQGLADLIDEQHVQRIGFDAGNVTVAQFDELKRLCPVATSFIPLTKRWESLRAIKKPAELAHLKQAADLNRKAFDAVLPLIRVGVKEREIALELEFALKKLGGETNAFDFIVASGVRGALPHGVASDKELCAGELVTIDFGTRYQGYHSDETVTVAVGEVDGNLRQMFYIVLEAHDCAIAAARSGIRACDLDAVARDLIVSKGFGEFFGHGLGHGVGLDVHEYPPLTTRNEDSLFAGMVVTIEPGIYLPGVGGVRIEDTIVITETGCECLTSIPKQFRQL